MISKFRTLLSLFPELWRTFEHYRSTALLLLFMLTLTSLLEVLSIGMLVPVLDIIVEGKYKGILGKTISSLFGDITPGMIIVPILGLFAILILGKNLFSYLMNRIHAGLSFGLRGYWICELMSRYVRSEYQFIVNSKQGTLINNVIVETEKAQLCLKFLVQFLSSAVLSMFMLFLLLIISWKVTLFALGIAVVLVFFSSSTIGRYSRRVGYEKLKYARSVGNTVAESISAAKQVKTLGMEDRLLNDFSTIIYKYVKTLSNFRVYSVLPQNLIETLTVLILVSVIIYIVNFTNISLKSLVSIVAVFVVVGNRISIQLSMLINSSMQILSNMVSLRRVFDLIKSDVRIENLDEGLTIDRIRTNIEISDVTFSYDKKTTLFQNLNLVIPKGKFVFLVGESGCGKSTIVDLLLRLRHPVSGAIRVNGKDLSEISIRSWRGLIGYVSQDIILFNKSIEENVRDGSPGATIDDIIAVCKKVNAHDFIDKFKRGYATIVGDRGIKLSGGQAQRIVLARAMLRDPDFLIFDEATSALDQKLEKEIIQEVRSSGAGKTVLFITHRLASAIHADVIYRIKNGRVHRTSSNELYEKSEQKDTDRRRERTN